MVKKPLRLFIICFVLFQIFACEKEIVKQMDDDLTYEQYGTAFMEIPAVEDLVIYEINIRAFSSTGDLKGIIDRLQEIKDLGINTIWLMPIHPIGEINSVNSPYSVKDYYEVGSEYGTLTDLRNLTDEAHDLGISVIIDWVANHTSWDNEWINNKSWYTQNASGNIIHPAGTNWQDVADLNFDNVIMRQTMIDAMKYWVLEANIDGFRCDHADGVPFEFWKQAITSLSSIPDRKLIFLAEGSREDHFAAGFDLNYSWGFYDALKNVFNGQSADNLNLKHLNEYNNIPAGKHSLRFTTNHDESAWDQTPMKLFKGKDGAIVASAITIFMGGVPMIYGSQEVGAVNNIPFFTNSLINWNANADMLKAYKEMINYYVNSPVSKQSSSISYPNKDVVCFKKKIDDKELLIIANIRNSQIDFMIPNELLNSSWTNAITKKEITLNSVLNLGSYEYMILDH